MKDQTKWFVFKKNDQVFGCFRIKQISDPHFDKAHKLLSIKMNIFNMTEMQKAQEFTMLIAKYLIVDWENIGLS